MRVGGGGDAKDVRWDYSSLNRVLPFVHLFLLSVSHVHRDHDIQTEIYRRILRTGGVGAETAIYGGSGGGGDRRRGGQVGNGGGGNGSDSRWRFEETVRAYRGLLTVKTLHGFLTARLEI